MRSDCTLQVHVNGIVSLDSPLYPAYYPSLYRYSGWQNSVIAPFWTDIDLSGTDGVVYFGHISRSSADDIVSTRDAEVYDTVRSLVVTHQGDTGFLPTEVVTVTWHNVSPFSGYWYRNEVRMCPIKCESVRA